MRITKCDICKKTIKRGTERLDLSYSNIKTFASFELCTICSVPIIKFLQDKKLIKIEENKKDEK
ncbi:MAG TPA: hypothetical protein DEA43_00315 [Candidatus Moranbacteria bacterium]|nr:hypothetical protein [Candidatus Moranbacteria bacterium]HBI33694.1 hypothetical protein [Candidatus Moranbacteria bacterium]HBI50223.1 hypothetical protein [Candidatus Moranbacteria bacterium]HBT45315.1 hypothetical protein [Candidatus Moranbacteria bacterium]HBU10640.1 hypothetical protein [Candidatus Moranbacteria bacterium]